MSSNKITVLIADDELPARNRLRSLLKDYNDFKIVSEAQNGDEVVSKIIIDKPQVAFLDINMPGSSVFDTIPSLDNPPIIIFQTAYSEYGAKAFDVNAMDYLVKPISRERFDNTINRIRTSLNIKAEDIKEKSVDVISVKSGEAIRVINIKKIEKIIFEDGFSFIYIGNDRVFSDKSLNHYDSLLEDKGFYRVSRNEIINISFVIKLHSMFKGQYLVELKSGDKITVSRRRLSGLKGILKI